MPLFPLSTVLFPGGILALRIFETRYLDMIRACMRRDGVFGVVLIKEGSEVGAAAQSYAVGTLASIVNWDMRQDGLLLVDVAGDGKFRVLQTQVQADQLLVGEVETLAAEPVQALPQAYDYMATIIRDLLPKIHPLYQSQQFPLRDAAWVGGRFAELLPLHPAEKQTLLELDDPQRRLQSLDSSFLALQRQHAVDEDAT
ncbi:MAG: LON peptidase substrate-binding domain-containing protein [Gammaproteobacteria bacterium]|nr:LON peptidase substrate-binding domain-containing protein [Gammaproteobacteria bacterium]